MEKFEVYCKEVCIGMLSVDGNKYKYVPNEEAKKLSNDLPIAPILLEERDWGEEIPFFKSRLEAAERFPGLFIGFQTDFYELKKV